MFSYFLVSLTYCGDKYGARESTFGHILGRCRTVPRSIAIDQESLMRHLGIIKIPLHNHNYITKQSKNKQPKNKGSADRRAVQCVGLFFFYRTYQLEKTATPIQFPRSPNKSRTVWWYLVRIWVTTCQALLPRCHISPLSRTSIHALPVVGGHPLLCNLQAHPHPNADNGGEQANGSASPIRLGQ